MKFVILSSKSLEVVRNSKLTLKSQMLETFIDYLFYIKHKLFNLISFTASRHTCSNILNGLCALHTHLPFSLYFVLGSYMIYICMSHIRIISVPNFIEYGYNFSFLICVFTSICDWKNKHGYAKPHLRKPLVVLDDWTSNHGMNITIALWVSYEDIFFFHRSKGLLTICLI